MRILLHSGPHKSGTTSLQAALRARFGTDRPGPIWYPPADPSGPGHAYLAWTLLGMNNVPRDPGKITEYVEQAAEAGCETLILSAEDFSEAYPDQLRLLAAALAGFPVDLVLTLSPVGRRAVSHWQEFVKHRFCEPVWQSLNAVLARPGFAPDLAGRFRDGLGARSLTIQIVDTTAAPEELFSNFAAAVGIEPFAEDDGGISQKINRTLGVVEVEVLRGLNFGMSKTMASDEEYYPARTALLQFMRSAEWRRLVRHEPLPVPPDWVSPLRERCAKIIRALRTLENRGEATIVGDPELLDDLAPATAGQPVSQDADA